MALMRILKILWDLFFLRISLLTIEFPSTHFKISLFGILSKNSTIFIPKKSLSIGFYWTKLAIFWHFNFGWLTKNDFNISNSALMVRYQWLCGSSVFWKFSRFLLISWDILVFLMVPTLLVISTKHVPKSFNDENA